MSVMSEHGGWGWSHFVAVKSITDDVFRSLSSVDDANVRCFSFADKSWVYQSDDDYPDLSSSSTVFDLPGTHIATPMASDRHGTTSRLPAPEEKAAPPPSDASPPAQEPSSELFKALGFLTLQIKSALRQNEALKGDITSMEHLCAAQARKLKSIEREGKMEKRRKRRRQLRRLKAESAKSVTETES